SNSAYLNASLLPVTNLKVVQQGNELPLISWTAPNGNLAGYRVYVGQGADKVLLTPSLSSARSFTDSGHTQGERHYTVASVDAAGVEMPRSIVLPQISAQVAAGLPLKRGVMNRLSVQVANTSAQAISGAKVIVRLPIDKAQSQFKDHPSEVLSLAPN